MYLCFLSVPITYASFSKDYHAELRSCMKVEVDVLGSPSLIVLNMVSVDIKQH